MKLFFSFLIISLSFIGVTLSQSLSDTEFEKIETSVTIYTKLLETLSRCKGNNSLNLENDVLKRNDGKNLKNLIYNDLFENESEEGYMEYIQIGKYLNDLEFKFKYNIEVEFSNMSIIDCKTINENYFFAIVAIDKELSYQGKKNKCPLLIFVNLKDYSITQIVKPDFFIKEKKQCWEQVPELNINDEVRQFRIEADKYFAQKDFLHAHNLYKLIVQKTPNDLTASKKSEECSKLITLQNLLVEADKNYREEKYETALSLYTRILNSQLKADKQNIENKIQLCGAKINEQQYIYYIGKGDGHLRVVNFEEARKNYYEALKYKPNDNYALKKIEQSKLNDKTYAKNEINKAIKLAEAGKRNFGEAFKIICEYEGSGLLTIENYYFLTLMMNNRNDNVKNYMNLNNRGCDYYLRVFSDKLRSKANIEPNTLIQKKAFRLLEEIINERNQKPNKRNQKRPT